MKLPKPHLNLVLDPSDRLEHTRFIQSLQEPGRAVCEIRPDARGTLAWLAGSMLDGLGKKASRAGHGRDAQLAWRRAIVWSESQQIEHLIVSRAQLLTPSDIEALLDLACLCQCELWLITHGQRLPRLVRETLATLPLKHWTWTQFAKRWRATTSPTRPAKPRRATRPRYQTLPDDEFTTFLASSDELLPKREARGVAQDFDQAFADTDLWLADQGEVANETAAAYLLGLLEQRARRPEMLVALRGAQAAFFAHRYLLKADLDRLLARRGEGFGADRAAELASAASTYASTSHQAASALSLIFDDPQLRIAASLNVGDIAADGSTVTTNGDEIDVVAPLRGPLKAQRLIRLFEGAHEHEPLFLSENKHRNGKRSWERTSARRLQRHVRDLARETGLPLIVRYTVSKRSSAEKWIFDLGISVRKLRAVRHAA